jgi:hypothetical protein
MRKEISLGEMILEKDIHKLNDLIRKVFLSDPAKSFFKTREVNDDLPVIDYEIYKQNQSTVKEILRKIQSKVYSDRYYFSFGNGEQIDYKGFLEEYKSFDEDFYFINRFPSFQIDLKFRKYILDLAGVPYETKNGKAVLSYFLMRKYDPKVYDLLNTAELLFLQINGTEFPNSVVKAKSALNKLPEDKYRSKKFELIVQGFLNLTPNKDIEPFPIEDVEVPFYKNLKYFTTDKTYKQLYNSFKDITDFEFRYPCVEFIHDISVMMFNEESEYQKKFEDELINYSDNLYSEQIEKRLRRLIDIIEVKWKYKVGIVPLRFDVGVNI